MINNMKTIFIVCISISFTFCKGENCDKYGVLIYEDFACTPKYGSDKKCPIKYDCENLGPSEHNCYFRGKAYQDGENVDYALLTGIPSCHVPCRCEINNGSSGFICAVLDCPEWLGEPLKKNCYRKYSLDSCCSTGQICPPFNSTETCVVNGREYKEGQQFYPKDACYNCICKESFKGQLEEPFCRRSSCGPKLGSRGKKIQEACAPFYVKAEALCCPDNYICPDNTEIISGEAKSDEICHFGNKTLKVGQYFDKSNHVGRFGEKFENVHCECVMPPLVKCENV